KTVAQSRLREDYDCMLVGFEDENGQIGLPRAEHIIRRDDLLWIVGEKAAIKRLSNDNID
ncbi:MAG: TrkA C-terminal domain-containing protein, partial [Bacteroidaceae bacterium]